MMSEMNEKAEEPQEQAADRPPIPPEQLKEILEAHRKWVESEGKEGERAIRGVLKLATPSKALRDFRIGLLSMRYLTPVSVYMFYAGVSLIALFAILNVLC